MKREPKTKEFAYSLLEIKAVDEDQRIITGIASTPEADRMGDIVEPGGAQFQMPIPFLKHHNAREPIGEIFEAKVTAKGIEIKARVMKAVASALLRERLDEAWEEMKLGLIRGLSIGFQPLEYAFLDEGGLRFVKWMWLELSAVTIPANQDANIQTVKSLDTARPRQASGAVAVAINPPGASGSGREGRAMKKTVQEQIQAFEATRQAKSARMNELMDGASEKGLTLDAAETEEYDRLADEVKGIDAHLVRLRARETEQKAAAVPARGDSPDAAAAARGHISVVSAEKRLPPGIEFARYAMCLAAAKGNVAVASEISKSRYPDMERIHHVLKAAVAAGTTTDPSWAGNLVQYQQYAGDFVEFLRPMTIIGRFGEGGIPGLRRVPFNVQIGGQTSGAEGYWVGEGRPKPLTSFSTDLQTLRWAKAANIAVITEELARFSSPSAEMLVRDELARAIIARLDTDFIDPDKTEGDASPASITNGATAIASSGSSPADIEADVAALMGLFIAANLDLTTGVWIMSATTALALSMLKNALGQKTYPEMTIRGGTFFGLPVIVSQYAAVAGSPGNSIVVLANASDIWLADDGQVVIDVSREASLEMSNAPTNSVAAGSPLAPVATSLVSLWQTNSIGIRAERYINWSRRRPEGVAYLTGVNWTGVSAS